MKKNIGILFFLLPLTLWGENNLVLVKAGTFIMGNDNELPAERPSHPVMISKDFYIGKYEVTQKLYKRIMGTNPSHHKGDNLPVEQVSWFDAINFCNELSKSEGYSPYYQFLQIGKDDNIVVTNSEANGYRLPTEAQWEYAAKGGMKRERYKYPGSSNAKLVAWFFDNTDKTREVGKKIPNELGIYDMAGNVWEFCSDWFGDYSSNSQIDPLGPNDGTFRVARGQDYWSFVNELRITFRDGWHPLSKDPGLGFRVVRPTD